MSCLVLLDSQSLFIGITGDDVKEKKPDPSIYIAAAKVNQCCTQKCISRFTGASFFLPSFFLV